MTSPAPFRTRPMAATILMASIMTIAVHCGDVTADANRSRRDLVDPYGPLSLYTKPMNLPIPPCYEVDIPEQEAKFFGGRMTTVYQTIIVKETVRPVCLLVDGNVPSCDQVIHDNNHRPKNPAEGAIDGRRPAAVVDYQSYFIEPSRPNVKIEITEIPFRGVFQLTDANVELQGDEGATEPVAEHPLETPPLRDARPVTEVVQDSDPGGGQRQFLQSVLGTAGSAVTSGLSGVVANVGGLAGGLVPNVAGLAGGLVPNVAGLVGVAGNVAAGSVTNAAGGNPKQVTVFVTRVDKVVDDRVTATLAPKNCMPDFGQLDLLRPCAIDPYEHYYQQLYLRPPKSPYHQQHQQQQLPPPQPPQYHQPPQYQQPPQPPPYQQPPQPPPYPQHTQPSAASVDIVSKVNGLVKDFVNAQTSRRGPHLYHTPSIDGPF